MPFPIGGPLEPSLYLELSVTINNEEELNIGNAVSKYIYMRRK